MVSLERKIHAELVRLEPLLFESVQQLDEWKMRRCYHKSPDVYEYLDADWIDLREGEHFGAPDLSAFLKNRIALNSGHKGKKVALRLRIGGEACVFVNGTPYNGLDCNRELVILSDCAQGDEVYDIQVEAYSKDLIMGSANKFVVDLCMTCSQVVTVNESLSRFYADVCNYHAFAQTDQDEYMRQRVYQAVYRSLLAIDYDAGAPEAQAEAAAARLAEELLPYAGQRIPVEMQFTGHSHIDVAWHWPLKETVRKVSRTFSSMLRLMERDQNFVFSQSMPVLYEMARQHYPDLFRQILERIKEGRWETVGSMYVEPDANIISGESFVRQIIFGKKYYREVLGSDSDICFLPDVFGYSPAMPQILKKAGTDYFFTTKLTWNETNEFPYSVFYWRGLDGTEILSGMQSMCTREGLGLYNGDLSAKGLSLALDYFKNKSEDTPILYLYGHGDGGGGVTPAMLDTLQRLDHIPHMPRITTGTVKDYFTKLEKGKNYPVWNGDLYFEKHRGTYTSAANNKKHNRKSEMLYRDAEILACLAEIETKAPVPCLTKGWEKILLNQFHDILPGTCVASVYEESDRDYEEIYAIGRESVANSLTALTAEDDRTVTVYNTLSWRRDGIISVEADGKIIAAADGAAVKQAAFDGQIHFLAEDIPAMGCRVYRLADGAITEAPVPQGLTADGDFFRITFNERGELTSLFDKTAGRDVLKPDRNGNVLRLLEDIPVEWFAAWETTRKREDRPPVLLHDTSAKIILDNDLYTVIETKGVIHQSAVSQRIFVYKHQPLIEFSTTVDWNERNRMLRVSFPVEINASDALYDVAFGNVARPNHRSTSHDEAKFEVCAHKWGDVSERNYGVSLLNDCKYGYSIIDSDIELSLLRSPDYPSPTCDRGTHTFTYWLYPHAGGIEEARVAQHGYEVNIPLHVVEGRKAGAEREYLTVGNESLIIDSFKKAEDGDGYIVRAFETYNTKGAASITFGFPVSAAEECDLLERKLQDIPLKGNRIEFSVKPFEILTFRMRI